MRTVFLCATLIGVFSGVAAGQGPPGVPPRTSPSDYPVHQANKTATVAAAIVPPDQVGKMFSPDIARQYTVVEVAVYPDNGQIVDIKALSFMLRVGDRTGGAEHPGDVAPYTQNQPPSVGQPVAVTTETGVIYGRTTGPANGRSTNLEAYSTVTVANGQPAPPPSSTSGPDPRIIADRLWDRALPEGPTGKAVAGYLYFPQYVKKRKSDALDLSYSDNDLSVTLRFPK